MTHRIAGIDKPPHPNEAPPRERPNIPNTPNEMPPVKEPPLSPHIDPDSDAPRRSEDHCGKVFCY